MPAYKSQALKSLVYCIIMLMKKSSMMITGKASPSTYQKTKDRRQSKPRDWGQCVIGQRSQTVNTHFQVSSARSGRGTPTIPTLRRLRQEDDHNKFQVNQVYIRKLSINK